MLIMDGFTYSLSRLLLPISYSSAVLAQMETLRLAGKYQAKMFSVPTPANPSTSTVGAIPAYSQVEEQIRIDPGSYIYGWMFSINGTGSGTPGVCHINVTDACTETPLSSDYILASLFNLQTTSTPQRGPSLLAQPRLISEPGLVNVEIYNNSASAIQAQLALFCSAPRSNPQPYAFDGNPGFHPGATSGRPQY
jgi:hypothetical protein